MKYSVKIFSRIGELMQGFLPDGSAFLVSGLPSRRFYSEALLEEVAEAAVGTATETVVDKPAEATVSLPLKAGKALDLFLRRAGSAPAALAGRSIRLYSNIPPGKGMASSSADILSVLYVVNDYLHAGFTADELYRIAAQVEPTDPCLSDDIVLFRQHIGVTDRSIILPPLTLLYFDAEPARQVDTLTVQRPFDSGTALFFESLLRQFLHAAQQKEWPALFDSITRSAVCNQSIIPLPGFDDYFQLARREQAGLMVAHSGTIIGLLTEPGQAAALLPQLEVMTSAAIHTEHYLSPPSS